MMNLKNGVWYDEEKDKYSIEFEQNTTVTSPFGAEFDTDVNVYLEEDELKELLDTIREQRADRLPCINR